MSDKAMWTGAVLFVVVVGFSTGRIVGNQRGGVTSSVPPLGVGQTVPEAVVHLSNGRAVPLDSLVVQGDRTVLVLFSTACSSCFAEAAVWEDLASSLISVQVVALAEDAAVTDIRSFEEEFSNGVRYARIEEVTRKRLGGVGLPTIYALDEEGRVEKVTVGLTATSDMEEWLRSKRR